MAAVSHLGFLKVENFNSRQGGDAWSKSVILPNFVAIVQTVTDYRDLLIFTMAAVGHLGL